MRLGEFCSACKHHYTYHENGEGECNMLYPPRFAYIYNEDVRKMAKTDRVYYSEVNFCMCRKFV